MPDFTEMYTDPGSNDGFEEEVFPPGSTISLTDYFQDDIPLKFGTDEDQHLYFDPDLENVVLNYDTYKSSGSMFSISNNEVEMFKFNANGVLHLKPVASLPEHAESGDIVMTASGKIYIGG